MINPSLVRFLEAPDAEQIVSAFEKLSGPVRASFVAHLLAVSGVEGVATPKPTLPFWVQVEASDLTSEELELVKSIRSETNANRAVELRVAGDLSVLRIAQLLGIGTPKIERFLASAQRRGVDVGNLETTDLTNRPSKKKSGKRSTDEIRKAGLKTRGDLNEVHARFIEKARIAGLSPTKVASVIGASNQAICQMNYDLFTRKGRQMPPVDNAAQITPELKAMLDDLPTEQAA